VAWARPSRHGVGLPLVEGDANVGPHPEPSLEANIDNDPAGDSAGSLPLPPGLESTLPTGGVGTYLSSKGGKLLPVPGPGAMVQMDGGGAE
jgi:hypothetical protein